VPISILHDRADLTGNNEDAVYARRELAKEHFHSAEMATARARDVQVILAYLDQNATARVEPTAAPRGAR
jgi:hypothetical protein